MIKVNLYQRKAAVGVTPGSGKGIDGLLEKFRGSSQMGGFAEVDKRGVALLVVMYTVILGAGWWYIGEVKSKAMAVVEAENVALDSKLSLLASELNKTSGYEQTKRSLEADEKTIRTKIETIQELIRDRSTPPKLLSSLSEAIPREAWLREFALRDRHFRISGGANSMDAVSDFMRGLEETIYFKGVVLKSSKQETVKGGHASASFELEAERR